MTADRQSGGQASTPEAPAPEAAAAAGGTGSLPLTAVHRTDAWLDDCFDAAEAKLAALLHDGCASGVRGTQRSGPVPVCSLPRVDIKATLAGAAPRTVAAAQGAHIGGTPNNMQVSTSERSSVRPCQKVNIVKWQQTCRVRWHIRPCPRMCCCPCRHPPARLYCSWPSTAPSGLWPTQQLWRPCRRRLGQLSCFPMPHASARWTHQAHEHATQHC